MLLDLAVAKVEHLEAISGPQTGGFSSNKESSMCPGISQIEEGDCSCWSRHSCIESNLLGPRFLQEAHIHSLVQEISPRRP